MPTITRRLEIDAGHRLMKHESKCGNIHGHRYAWDITCAGELDEVGRVIDFSKIKELVGGWLDEHWDHGFIAEAGDPIIDFLRTDLSKVYVLETPPTAEYMSEHLFEQACALLAPYGIQVLNVRCYETPNCWADAALEHP